MQYPFLEQNNELFKVYNKQLFYQCIMVIITT